MAIYYATIIGACIQMVAATDFTILKGIVTAALAIAFGSAVILLANVHSRRHIFRYIEHSGAP